MKNKEQKALDAVVLAIIVLVVSVIVFNIVR